MSLADEVRAVREKERAELDRAVAKYEQDAADMNASICAACGRRWFTVLSDRPKRPRWIPEAQAWMHLICYQRIKEQR